MYYFIIDTCVWLNLGNNIFNTKLIDKIEDFVFSNKVCLILPDVIEYEWNKHKNEKIFVSSEKSVAGKLSNIKQLSKFVCEENQKYVQDILKLEDEIKLSTRKQAKDLINRIDSLFNNTTTKKVLCNDKVKLKAVEWGLKKKAPFHKKSSMADALIILSSIYYMKNHSLFPSIFITENKDDFSAPTNSKEVHKDLKNLFDDNKVSYFTNIGEALNKIETNAISDDIVKEIEDRSNQMTCYRCGAIITDTGAWHQSQYGGGLTWQYKCYECGTYYDTRDFFD